MYNFGGSMTNKVFHIYSEGKCLHHNLNEDSFNGLWEHYFMEGVKCQYEVCDEPKVLEEVSY
tara:strand:+ start:496 stop:681 length:186 start_codon:yes stop_codon:yes gene_type:complete